MDISDFETLLSIVFGLNTIFYIFSVFPLTKQRINELIDRYKEEEPHRDHTDPARDPLHFWYFRAIVFAPLYIILIILSLFFSITSIIGIFYCSYKIPLLINRNLSIAYFICGVTVVPVFSYIHHKLIVRHLRWLFKVK